ncbi:MAG: zinc ABC transporter substrate-binding protein [Thermanaerothrix sp.]|nr:zinc ABC transporter substrate-binding protein [Thermanaerothrix sp.]
MPAWGHDKRLTVLCPVEPLSYLARRVGGDRVKVVTLIPKGADPHSFEMRPSHARAISQVDVMFYLGLPLEESLLPKLESSKVRVAPLKFSKLKGHHHGEDAGHGESFDPHAWNSLSNGRSMAVSMAETLKALDPANGAVYDANLASLLKDMDRLDREISTLLSPFKGRAVLAYHPAWNYFCAERGIIPLAVESRGMEARPKELAKLREEVRRRGIRVMFVQPSASGPASKATASMLKVKPVELDPLEGDWFKMMQKTARAFAEALKGR